MVEYVTLNGTAVRVTSLEWRRIGGPSGEERDELRLVVVLPGAPAHFWFRSLLEATPVRLALPGQPERSTVVVASSWTTQGNPPVYRHELTLRDSGAAAG